MAIYELGSIAAFLAVLVWAVRSRNPVNLGALLGGFMIFGFDWLWCSKAFFNATFTPNLTMIPGIHILGEQYPIAVACNWAVGYGFGPLLLSKFHAPIGRALGRLHFPAIFAACALTDMLIEAFLISGLGIYKYHQAPQFLLWGVAWSNIWLLGGLLTLSYFGLAYVQKWAAIPDGAGFGPCSEMTWKGLSLSAGAIWTSAFFLTVIQFFWYSAATPWVESGRLF
ncbi:MAG: hypothetical protein M0P39_11885 [Rhodocyclaceae bacterium]|jgi:hypothetical protein|nr:hypothetical protein [Rhodocyclaceae bacterium]